MKKSCKSFLLITALFAATPTLSVFAQAPVITSLSTSKGNPGSAVIITGTNFDVTPANNIVYFGAVRALVTAATATSLTVTVPVGATYDQITVNNATTSLTGYSRQPFLPTYDNSGYIPGIFNVDQKVSIMGTFAFHGAVCLTDMDGDGKADVIRAAPSNRISILRNISTTGSITTSSFESAANYDMALIPGNTKMGVAVGDLDGDGRPDIAAIKDNVIALLRNTASTAPFDASSFEPYVYISIPGAGAQESIVINDIDGDGKSDLIVNNGNVISVLRNVATSGISFTNTSFEAPVDFATASTGYGGNVVVSDLDNDGKPEIINIYDGVVSVLKNATTGGALIASSFGAHVDLTTGTAGSMPGSIAVSDLDGDSKPDIITNSGGIISVLRNVISGAINSSSFEAHEEISNTASIWYYANTISASDMNGDGKPDLVFMDNGFLTTVLQNNTTPGAITSTSFLVTRNHDVFNDAVGYYSSITVGDIDGDKKPDIVFSWDVGLSFFRNAPFTPINGPSSLCIGATTTLSEAATGGTWSSDNGAVAAIDINSGVVTAISAGTTTISYTLSGDTLSTVLTVNPLPASISGFTDVCTGATTTLANTDAGGTWSSNNTTVATINSGTGILTGATAGTTTITYTLPTGCTATSTVTVNPLPAAITGTMNVCAGLTTTLSNATGTGTWSSSNTAVATINSLSGLVNGPMTGTATVTYTLPSTGCIMTAVVTVNPLPAAITGTATLCSGLTTALTDVTPLGTWSSNNTGIASANATTGVVTGIITGNTIITYTLPTGCMATTVVSVKANPMASLTGSSSCIGSLLTVYGTPYSNIEWQNNGTTFKIMPSTSGMDATGTSIGTSDGITPMGVYVTPTGDMYVADIFSNRIIKYTAGFTGTSTGTVVAADGLNLPSSVYVDAAGKMYVANFGDNNIIEFPAGSTSTTAGTIVAADGLNGPSYVTVNGLGDIYVADNNNNRVIVFPAGSTSTTPGTVRASGFTNVQSLYLDPSDTMYVADFSGNSILKYAPGSSTGTIVAGGNGAGSAANQFSSAAGLAVDANGNIFVSDKDNHRVQMFPAGSTGATNGVTIAGTGTAGSGSNELSSPMNLFTDNYGSVYIADLGNNRVQVYHSGAITDTTTTMVGGEYSAIVTGTNGCIVTTNSFHINTVGDITGSMQVCAGLATSLSDTSAGGTWSSSDLSIATIDATTGVATGASAGTTTITYTTPAGCTMTEELTVNPLPSAITGAAAVCEGQTTTLSSPESGAWSSGSTGTATIDAGTGIVTGVAAGNATITFTLPTTCISTTTITVNPIPVAYTVTGGGNYCAGDTGVVVGLISSDAGINYQLYNGTAIAGADSAGTGAAINFGLQTVAGSYTIVATNNTTSCSNTMTSAAIVGINPLPTVYNVTGGGNYCDMGAGVPVGLNGSDLGFDYLLYKGGAIVASPMAGTGTSLNFGLQKGAGSYTIVSVNAITGCRSLMFDSAGIIINPLVIPTISLSTSLYDTVCEGYMDTFTAVITNGGAHPFYQWTVNGVNAGTNSPTFSYMPVNGDVVVALLISDAACVVTPTTATTSITVKAERIFIPSVTITSSHGSSIEKGEQVTLEAEVANAGPAPKYQWLKNGIAISGATTRTYVTTTLNNRDSITCVVLGTGRCSYPSFNSIIVNVHGLGVSGIATTSDIHVMPNPSKGTFTVNGTLGTRDDQEVTLSITNMVGQVIYNQQIKSSNGTITQDIQLSNSIARGMYLLSVRTANENKVFHLVIE